MVLKKLLLSISALFYITCGFAQERIEKKNRINDDVTEKYYVLKSNENIRDSIYMAYYKRKTRVVIGHYSENKKTGNWYFYDRKGTLLQVYNYSKDSLKYEAREDISSHFRYIIDKEIADTDRVTKPIKAGGRYYGYLPYLGMYKLPFNPYVYGTYDGVGTVELLISPMGRLAAFKVRVMIPMLQFDQTVTMDVKLFKEEDRKFIPATYNHEPVLCRITIGCRVTSDGGLDFF